MPRYLATAIPQAARPAESAALPAVVEPLEPSQPEHFADADFQYTGSGRLTVTGPITGAVYYFSSNGESVTVHGADAPSLAAIPGLKVVS
jgi:hypothetical protein